MSISALAIIPFTWKSFLFDIIFTLVIYMLPLDIYRFFIKKSPLPRKIATKTSYIYGFLAWLILSVVYYLLGLRQLANMAAAFIWSSINILIISAGYSDQTSKDNIIDSEDNIEELKKQTYENKKSITLSILILGVSLIIIQLLFSLSNPPSDYFSDFTENILHILGHFLLGIIGVFCVIFGSIRYYKIKTQINDDSILECKDHSNKIIDQPNYCRKCGIKLPKDSEFCNKCGTKVMFSDNNIIFCPNCKTVLAYDSKFCTHCGLNIEIIK